jgi:RimJ/RimL family protein N-acetyltransferase
MDYLFMVLTSARLIYRPPSMNDAERLFQIYSDPLTQAFNPAGPMSDRGQATALLDAWIGHWERYGWGWWAIAERAEPERVIGFGGVAHYDYLGEARVNVGYRFATEAWGKGFATELGRAALEHAFLALGIERVWALVRPDHQASIKVLEKIGMVRSGTLDDVPGQAESLVFLGSA